MTASSCIVDEPVLGGWYLYSRVCMFSRWSLEEHRNSCGREITTHSSYACRYNRRCRTRTHNTQRLDRSRGSFRLLLSLSFVGVVSKPTWGLTLKNGVKLFRILRPSLIIAFPDLKMNVSVSEKILPILWTRNW